MMCNLKLLKATVIFFAGIALVFAAERGLGPNPSAIKPRMTHDQIASQQKPRALEERKEVNREEVLRVAHKNERQSKGLMSRSSIISSHSNWTLVPKGAVLHVPALYGERVEDSRNGTLIGWQEFLGKNRGWIRALPVSIEQARGEEPLAEEYLESVKRAGQVVVAVCRGGPISMKAPNEDPEDPEEPSDPSDPEIAAAEPEGAEERAAREADALKDLKRRLRLRSN